MLEYNDMITCVSIAILALNLLILLGGVLELCSWIGGSSLAIYDYYNEHYYDYLEVYSNYREIFTVYGSLCYEIAFFCTFSRFFVLLLALIELTMSTVEKYYCTIVPIVLRKLVLFLVHQFVHPQNDVFLYINWIDSFTTILLNVAINMWALRCLKSGFLGNLFKRILPSKFLDPATYENGIAGDPFEEGRLCTIKCFEGTSYVYSPRFAAHQDKTEFYRFIDGNHLEIFCPLANTTQIVKARLPNVLGRTSIQLVKLVRGLRIPVVVESGSCYIIPGDNVRLYSKYQVNFGLSMVYNIPFLHNWYTANVTTVPWESSGLKKMKVCIDGTTVFATDDEVTIAEAKSYSSVEMPLKLYNRVLTIDKVTPGTLKNLAWDGSPVLTDYSWFTMMQHVNSTKPRLLYSPWHRLPFHVEPAVVVPVEDRPPPPLPGENGPPEEPPGDFPPPPDQAKVEEPIVPKAPLVMSADWDVHPDEITQGGLWAYAVTADLQSNDDVRQNIGQKALFGPVCTPTWGAPTTSLRQLELLKVQRYDKYPQEFKVSQPRRDELIALATRFAQMHMRGSKLEPVTIPEVEAQQGRPSQQAVLKRGQGKPQGFRVKKFASFPKNEAMNNCKPLRPIVNFPDHLKADYSSYIMALANFMKENREMFHWYAFGLNPQEIAEAVVNKAFRAQTVSETDMTAFDVTVNCLLRTFERIFLNEAFPDHPAILELHRQQYDKKARLIFEFEEKGKGRIDVEVDPQYGRHSGSPETSMLNSWINAFLAFVTYYDTCKGTFEERTTEAQRKLGMYGGDDGVSFDIDSATYVANATEMGLRLKSELIKSGEPFHFLSKEYYPCAWTGTPCCASVAERALGKMHWGGRAANPLSDHEMIYLRAKSYAETDATCPLIGTLARKIASLVEPNVKSARKDAIHALFEQSFQSSTNEGLTLDGLPADRFLGYVAMTQNRLCDRCAHGRTLKVSNYKQWLHQLQAARTLEELPVLHFLKPQEQWSTTWTKLFFDRNDLELTQPIYAETGTLAAMPEIEPRRRRSDRHLDSLPAAATAGIPATGPAPKVQGEAPKEDKRQRPKKAKTKKVYKVKDATGTAHGRGHT